MNNIDYIQTVKISGEGYLVNDSMSVPKADGNRHYEAIKQWLKTNTPEPEYTEEELLAQENATKVSEAKQYLSDTDFYMTIDKYATLTTERQEELTQLRAEARALINSLEGDE